MTGIKLLLLFILPAFVSDGAQNMLVGLGWELCFLWRSVL